jgi:hypothetical protein
MMEELQKREDAFKVEKQDAQKSDAVVNAMNAVNQFGASYGAGQAQVAGGVPLKAQNLGLEKADTASKLTAPNLQDYVKKVQMMKTLKSLQGGGVKESDKLAREKFDYKKEIDKLGKDVKPMKVRTVNEAGEEVTQFIHPYTKEVLKEFPIAEKKMTDYQKKYLKAFDKSVEYKKERGADNLDLRKIKEEQRQKEKINDIQLKANTSIYNVTKDFEGNAMKKSLDKQCISFHEMNELTKLIRKCNQIALGGIGVKAARAMGEVGVLTDTDVQRYIEAQSVAQKMKDKYGRLTKGMLSAKTLKDLDEVNKKMLDGFKKREAKIFKTYTNRAYENFGKKAGLTKKDIYTRFGMDYKLETPKTFTETQIQKAADKSFGGDMEKARAYYESKGYRSK